MNPFDLNADIGRANNDQRHRVVWSGTLSVPQNSRGNGWRRAAGGFEFSHIFTYASAYPFNIQTGGSLFGDGNNNARPPGVSRNTGEGFDFSSLDLRLARRFHLTERWNVDVLADSFNTFNRVNLLAPNGTITSASFGQATNASRPAADSVRHAIEFLG
jgi:hypothetical protein